MLTNQGYMSLFALFEKKKISLPQDFLLECDFYIEEFNRKRPVDLSFSCNVKNIITLRSLWLFKRSDISILVNFIVKHIQKINFLRRNICNILCVGCEVPEMMFFFFGLLSSKLYDYTIGLHILVLDSNPDTCAKGNALREKYELDKDTIRFESINFLNYHSARISEYDIAMCFISSVTNLFALKFIHLTVQESTRGYYRSAKLFLASKQLFHKAGELSTSSIKIKRNRVLRVKTNNSPDETDYNPKNIYQLQSLSVKHKEDAKQYTRFIYKYKIYSSCEGIPYVSPTNCSLQQFILEI